MKPKLANLQHGINLIPEDLHWLIGKGRMNPDEKLYGCVILDQGGNTVGEGESDDLMDAVAEALADLKRRTAS